MQNLQKMFGIGIDLVDINRFKQIRYKTNKSFYNKIFNKSEITYCLKFKDPYRHFAGKFAIKEAVKKSVLKKLSFLDIQTYHRKEKPFVKIKNRNEYSFLVSVSHDADIAAAIVFSIFK
jgi:holo-[acyl-carrier-protein] synthase